MSYELFSTKGDIKKFKDSFIWRDFINTLSEWDEGLDIEQQGITDAAIEENATSAKVLLHTGDINGRRKAIRYFLSIPDIIIEALEDIKDDSKRK